MICVKVAKWKGTMDITNLLKSTIGFTFPKMWEVDTIVEKVELFIMIQILPSFFELI